MKNLTLDLRSVLKQYPHAYARIMGSDEYPGIRGWARLYTTNIGTLVAVEASGLPRGADCASSIFALHVHSGNACTGNESDPFANAMTHYNPKDCLHPYHAGDLPPLFGSNGYALSVFLTGRFTVGEVIGKAIIIHSSPDDFTTQPAGNSGAKIACGIIKRR